MGFYKKSTLRVTKNHTPFRILHNLRLGRKITPNGKAINRLADEAAKHEVSYGKWVAKKDGYL